ncbi:MAG: major facilitator superfamily 1 [Firmicutes bacterium]|nr:major facilitator superfamily 1 [Bacillota bacterium]
MKILDNYKGLPQSVYMLFGIQIINRLGDFVFPFLALFLTVKLGLSVSITGIVVMITSLSSLIASFVGGRLADTRGRRKTYLMGQTVAAGLVLICGFIQNQATVVGLLIIATFFVGVVRPTLSAVLTDVLPVEKRQAGIALNHLGVNIGVAVGPLVAGFLFEKFLPLMFITDAITSFVAVFIFYKFIPETNLIKQRPAITNQAEKAEPGTLWQTVLKRPELLVFLIIYTGYCFIYRQGSFALPLMLNTVFPLEGAAYFGALISVNALTVVCLSLITVAVTKRFHSLNNIIVGGIFYGIGFGMIGLITTFPMFILSTVLWSIGEILVVTNVGVYIANNSPENFRARFSALGNLSSAIGGALGTSLMGVYITTAGVIAVWPLTLILAGIAVFSLYVLKAYSNKVKACRAVLSR